MNNSVLLIYLCGAVTIIIGSAAVITMSADAGRTAELAQGLGATEITQGAGESFSHLDPPSSLQ